MEKKYEEAFVEEAFELLNQLESALLELENDPHNSELLDEVFRAMHTIKGSGSMFGFNNIANLAHEAEALLDSLRQGAIPVTREAINLTLSAADKIRLMLKLRENHPQTLAAEEEEKETLIEQMRNFTVGRISEKELNQGKGIGQGVADKGVIKTYRIRFTPLPHILHNGLNVMNLLKDLQELGKCRIIAHPEDIPPLEDLDPEACYVYWDAVLTTACGIAGIRDVFIFAEEDCELKIDVIDEQGSLNNPEYKRLGEILVERGDLRKEDLRRILKEQKHVGDMLVEAGLVEPAHIEAALLEQRQVQEASGQGQKAEQASVRVSSEKLDILVNYVSELVTMQARLCQTALDNNDPQLIALSEEAGCLTDELRDLALSMRMLPIGSTFSKFRRLVRDLSIELDREVEMIAQGAETELDKTVIEKLNDPLVHLIRNCIAHGIESPEVRESLGKPRKGTIRLSAVHSGAHVIIKIADDGAGLDKEAIRIKAEEKGEGALFETMEDAELFQLIFRPGFSTVKNVTNAAGRGVGMDVVKKTVDELKGSVEITSEKNSGTEITLRLPLTLAIIEGLLVRAEDEFYVMPLAIVEECIELNRKDIQKANGRHIANLRGQVVPYVRLRECFDINGSPPLVEQVIVTTVSNNRVGLVVDEVIGQHQTVIKTLGKMREVEGISGATILGDGTVALLVDIPKLVNQIEKEALCTGT